MNEPIVKNVNTTSGNINFVRTGDTTRVSYSPCKGVHLVFIVRPSALVSNNFVATGYLPGEILPDKYAHVARTEEGAYRGFMNKVKQRVQSMAALSTTKQVEHLRLVMTLN